MLYEVITDLMKKQMHIEEQIAQLQGMENKDQELEEKQKELLYHLENHPGFGNKIITFNTLTFV